MLIDTHCHLDAAEFDPDRDAVLVRARAGGVKRQVVPAVDAAGWPKLKTVCAAGPGLFAAYGLHPMYLPHHCEAHLPQLREWVEREQPAAIGECGLDYFIPGLDPAAQRFYFDAQLRLAREFELPVIVHARRAVDAVLASIRRIGGLQGVVHSFSGSAQQAGKLWDEGFLLGIGGPVTYDRANRLRSLVATMPIERLLLETDAPDQPDAGIRGQRNEPARLPAVLQVVAQLRGCGEDEVAAATTDNAERLFRLPPLR